MAQVETVTGPIDSEQLGTTLMHEHVFVLNEEIRRNFPGDWDEQERIDDAAAKLTALAGRGCATIADPTVLGLGRDIARVQQVAARTDLNIIAATGLYTYGDVPLYFRSRGLGHQGTERDPMTAMFISDLTEGIAGTGVKAAFLKCAIDAEGMTPGVERTLRCVVHARLATGAPITVHTHPGTRTGLAVLAVLRELGADLAKVVLGHSGDTTDTDDLAQLADAGCLLGRDRFGLNLEISFEQRVGTVAAMCARGVRRWAGAAARTAARAARAGRPRASAPAAGPSRWFACRTARGRCDSRGGHDWRDTRAPTASRLRGSARGLSMILQGRG